MPLSFKEHCWRDSLPGCQSGSPIPFPEVYEEHSEGELAWPHSPFDPLPGNASQATDVLSGQPQPFPRSLCTITISQVLSILAGYRPPGETTFPNQPTPRTAANLSPAAAHNGKGWKCGREREREQLPFVSGLPAILANRAGDQTRLGDLRAILPQCLSWGSRKDQKSSSTFNKIWGRA